MYLLAGTSTFLVIPALLLSGIFGALFFLRRGDHYGPFNDLFFALSLFLMILPVIAVNDLADERVGIWFDAVTWAAVVGIVVAGVGQVLLVAGAINVQTSFKSGGIGIAPVLAWMVSLAWISIRKDVPDALVGWTMALSLVLMVPTALLPAFQVRMSLRLWAGAILGLVLVAWLFALGVDLVDRA